jgi:hypothetical protein
MLLGPRPVFLHPPKPYKNYDVVPWRYNRRLSVIQRPLLLRKSGEGEEEVLWGPRLLNRAGDYLIRLIFDGRLRHKSAEMATHLGQRNNERGKSFNDAVAGILSKRSGVTVQREVKAVDRQGGSNEILGDIDVLAIDWEQQQIRVIECKSLALARNPHEMLEEMEKLRQDEEGEKSAERQALTMADWVRANLREVLGTLDRRMDRSAEEWTVIPLIVVDHVMLTPYLVSPKVDVVWYQDLA